MQRWMSGVTLKDKIRNNYIRETLEVAPIDKKKRENVQKQKVQTKEQDLKNFD